MLAADLHRALLSGCDLADALQLELPGVVSPQLLLLLHPDVNLHPISGEVDLRSCPVLGVHPNLAPPLGEKPHKLASILVEAATPKDGYTSEHASQVACLSQLVGEELSLNEEEIEMLVLATLLHDLGKLGVADAVLEKPGPLTEEEWTAVKRHPDIGARMLEPLEVLSGVIPVVRHHHERYDGNGYPDGLEGEEIPLAARMVAAVDAYDVMRRGGPYRQRRTQAEALEELSVAQGETSVRSASSRGAHPGDRVRAAFILTVAATRVNRRSVPSLREFDLAAI